MAKTDDILPAFDRFTGQIMEQYALARAHLEAGRWEAAQLVLANLATTHARTSLSLRNVLVKRGFTKGDD